MERRGDQHLSITPENELHYVQTWNTQCGFMLKVNIGPLTTDTVVKVS